MVFAGTPVAWASCPTVSACAIDFPPFADRKRKVHVPLTGRSRKMYHPAPPVLSSFLSGWTAPEHLQALTAQHEHHSRRNQRPRAPTEYVLKLRIFQSARQPLIVN